MLTMPIETLYKIKDVLSWIISFENNPTTCKNYYGFDSISQKELDTICDCLNPILDIINIDYYITNTGGEIIPVKKSWVTKRFIEKNTHFILRDEMIAQSNF